MNSASKITPFLKMLGTSGMGSFEISFDLCLGQYETLVIMGKNGSGKTTLLKTLAGLLPLSEKLPVSESAQKSTEHKYTEHPEISIGTEILDNPLTRHFVPPHLRNVYMVFSEPRLFDFLNLTDNTAFGLRRKGILKELATDIAKAQLQELGLGNYLDQKPSVLSRGQAQKASLARVLVMEPEVLLLDEPLTGMDTKSQADMLAIFKNTRATKLYVTHSVEEAETIGDDIYKIAG